MKSRMALVIGRLFGLIREEKRGAGGEKRKEEKCVHTRVFVAHSRSQAAIDACVVSKPRGRRAVCRGCCEKEAFQRLLPLFPQSLEISALIYSASQ